MTAIAHHPHPVTAAVMSARAQLSEVAGAPVFAMSPVETTATLEEVLAAESQLAELKSRLLTHAGTVEVHGATAASSVATWWAAHSRTTRAAAHRAVRIAAGLESHGSTREALAAGSVNLEQAEVILRALSELPDNLDPAITTEAEEKLLDLADTYDAKALRVLGRRILEVVAPDVADAHEAALLDREERAAAAATRFTMWEDGHGRVHGRFTLGTVPGAMLKKALWAIASPKHRAATQGTAGERRPTPERLGQAFTELIERYPTKRLPKTGGLNATIVVTMTLDTLLGGLKAAGLDTGQQISPGEARRLACQAGIIPAVLDGASQVLDLGTTQRFYSEGQRIAKAIETGGCEADGCDMPPGMCHMHHPKRWADGGETNRDGIMICPWHHRRAHDPRYRMQRTTTGRIEFHRRT